MLNLYADFCEEVLAIPVIKGRKTDKENLQAQRQPILSNPLCMTEKPCSQVPATTLVMDLQRHLTFSIQTRTTP